jgi:AraC-like DNA-binding protein
MIAVHGQQPNALRRPLTHVVPTIRAGALLPAASWAIRHGHPVAPSLRAAGLGEDVLDEPGAPIPVDCVAKFLRLVARVKGPEALWRAGLATDLMELGGLGAQLLSVGTLERALRQIEAPMVRHCTHERIAVEARADGVRIHDVWTHRFDPETLHCVQLYTAGIVGAVCTATGAEPPLFSRIALTPHPELGFRHLQPWIGEIVAEATDAALVIDVPWTVARAPFRAVARDAEAPRSWRPLREGQSFATSVQRAIAGMLGGQALTVERVAAASGMTVRTFQRRLMEEGTTFSAAIEAARRAEALALIMGNDMPLDEIAGRLGYANASALTRAVRRWTGAPPRALRSDIAAGRRARQS